MSNGFGELAKQLADIRESVPLIANEAAKDTCLAMVRYGVYNMPVDTSKALSNWQVAFNSRPETTLNAYTEGTAGSSLTASAEETIRQASFSLTAKQPGDVIFLSNTTPYITYINDGTEKIAASNFAERMIVIGQNFSIDAPTIERVL